jgi:hypothetical protein
MSLAETLYTGRITCPNCGREVDSYTVVLYRDSAGMPVQTAPFRQATCCSLPLKLPLLRAEYA